MVERCQPDTVIVDLNADIGGNCELTVPGETVVTNNRIHVVGEEHLARRIPKTASAFFSNNVTDLLSSLSEDGNLNLSEDNPILTGSPESDPLHVPDMGGVLVCHNGNVPHQHPTARSFAMIDPSLFLLNLTLFVLAIFWGGAHQQSAGHLAHPFDEWGQRGLGHQCDWRFVGTQIVMQDGERSVASLLAGLALMLAMANVVGGFAVTHRMLNMFKKKS